MSLAAQIPPEFEKALDPFRRYFGTPAFEHLKRYIVGLIVSENLTTEGINRIHIQSKHPGSMNRFLTVGVWDDQEVNKERIQRLKARGPLDGSVWLIVDDTLTHKTGEEIEGVGFFWDHSEIFVSL